jgi:uncharacterized membrane protein YdjX (TVP38/TMEM64 family)
MSFITWGTGLVYSYGLIGVFIIAMLSASTIMVVLPGWVLIVLAGHIYPPFLVGVVGALGYVVGETSAYLLGRGGNYIIEKKHLARLDKIKGWFQKRGFVMLPVFAMIPPLPLDLLSVVAGTLKYDLKKFWLGVFLGELVKCMAYAYAGYYGIRILGF